MLHQQNALAMRVCTSVHLVHGREKCARANGAGENARPGRDVAWPFVPPKNNRRRGRAKCAARDVLTVSVCAALCSQAAAASNAHGYVLFPLTLLRDLSRLVEASAMRFPAVAALNADQSDIQCRLDDALRRLAIAGRV